MQYQKGGREREIFENIARFYLWIFVIQQLFHLSSLARLSKLCARLYKARLKIGIVWKIHKIYNKNISATTSIGTSPIFLTEKKKKYCSTSKICKCIDYFTRYLLWGLYITERHKTARLQVYIIWLYQIAINLYMCNACTRHEYESQ